MPIPKFPELEEQVLKDWKDKDIFKKTLAKPSPQGRFVFYDGPPTANGIPHIGHVETRAFKDIIPRFKTMQGYRVERKAGWDTQGLPVELEVEKELGLSGKKDIEKYGIEKFNAQAKESVWKYKDLWEKMTERVGFWLDTEHPYITYQPEYIESLWWIFKQIWDQKLLAQDYKVVPYCPRCGTALSSHEVAQGYENIEEPAVYVKFELVDEPKTFILAWTTTPWTLPGNVALAVDPKIQYTKITFENGESYIVADSLIHRVFADRLPLGKKAISGKPIRPSIVITRGVSIIGKRYRPLFDFLDLRAAPSARRHSEAESTRLKNLLHRDGDPSPRSVVQDDGRRAEGAAYTIVPADFVTTEDGTGVVHTAVMYGVEDFELGKNLDLPKIHTVDETGRFNELIKPWVGLEVKDPKGETQKKIMAWLQEHGKLYKAENYRHDYPFCWRCNHPLLYYAKTSWFILMTKLRDQLIANNAKVNWYPSHIKEGRFGEWLREVKDWAISRERYWGTPLPIWECNQCHHQECLESYEELTTKAPTRNRYIFVRHGGSTNNDQGTLNTEPANKDLCPLTPKGKKQAEGGAKKLKHGKVDAIYSSQFRRAKETAEIIAEEFNLPVTEEARINEYHIGPVYEGKTITEFHDHWGDRSKRVNDAPPGGETWMDIRTRMFKFLHELDAKHEGKTFVIVTHADPILVTRWALSMQPAPTITELKDVPNGQPQELKFPAQLFQPDGSFDPHRPFIDNVVWPCPKCSHHPRSRNSAEGGKRGAAPPRAGGVMKRIPEVADAWFDSGAMPFAQWHYPFENKNKIDNGEAYPADYISEAIDQTRGWFYTLLAISTLLQQAKVVKKPSYKNVVVLGFLNDAKGRKLSKSLKNYGDLDELFATHGADAVRWFMYTANQPWDPKNFDTKIVDEGVKKTFLILINVVSFWQLFDHPAPRRGSGHPSPLGLVSTSSARHRDELGAERSDGRRGGLEKEATHPLDRWIRSMVNVLTKDVTERLERYDITGAARAIGAFVTDLSTWFVRRSRDRFKSNQTPQASATLKHVLLQLSTMMAPFTPFLAEHVYRTVGGKLESVHLEDWPAVGKIDERLLADMATARRVVEQGHALRAQLGIKVRQPLSQVITTEQLSPGLDEIVRSELNVEEVLIRDDLPTGIGWVIHAGPSRSTVALNNEITDELREKGMLRDLIREFNALRKTAKLKPSDEIVAHVQPNTTAAKVIEVYSQEFLKEVRAKAVTPSVEGANQKAEITLDGGAVTIGLTKP